MLFASAKGDRNVFRQKPCCRQSSKFLSVFSCFAASSMSWRDRRWMGRIGRETTSTATARNAFTAKTLSSVTLLYCSDGWSAERWSVVLWRQAMTPAVWRRGTSLRDWETRGRRNVALCNRTFWILAEAARQQNIADVCFTLSATTKLPDSPTHYNFTCMMMMIMMMVMHDDD